MIKMFPSAAGSLSIEYGRSDAFTEFLRAEPTRKHAVQILAALLLLSEGIDISITLQSDQHQKSPGIFENWLQGHVSTLYDGENTNHKVQDATGCLLIDPCN
ncbi:hypothetical protein NEAUS03_1341 [Nematocida ausubeli]|nr:hypothetical protein NEAUS03_1341 [Nematocida ausubeli]